MNVGEATEVVTLLASAFPRRWRGATAEETQLWVEFLQSLYSFEAAREATSEIIKTATEMPSVAEFRTIYYTKVPKPAELEEGYENDPRSPDEWAEMAKKHRVWRKTNYPGTADPCEGKPLPTTRRDFGLEWAAWFKVHFGWAPTVTF